MLIAVQRPWPAYCVVRRSCTLCLATLLFLTLSSLVGCVTSHRMAGDPTLLTGVPFYQQEAYECGPAALATVINYWHAKTGAASAVTPDEIVTEIFSPSARGVLGIDLALYAKKRGFQTHTLTGSPSEIKKQIDEGIPPIILVDYGFSFYQRNHFMVVTGYAANGVLVNSGRAENEFIEQEDFLKIWKKTGYWMLVVRP